MRPGLVVCLSGLVLRGTGDGPHASLSLARPAQHAFCWICIFLSVCLSICLSVCLSLRERSLSVASVGAIRQEGELVTPCMCRQTDRRGGLRVCAGTFLYVAFMEVIPKELLDSGHKLLKLLFLTVGFGLMSLLAVWA
jgi:ZIP Zinc transporter